MKKVINTCSAIVRIEALVVGQQPPPAPFLDEWWVS